MPVVRDFRSYPYSLPRIERCGRYIGRHSYWRLYAIENILRIVINSVLLLQIGPTWWNSAVDPKTISYASKRRKGYARHPQHTSPGIHDIHYIYLSDLNSIMRANSNFFLPVIPNIDAWMVRIEGIRTPRNLIGHMNFPHLNDRQRIDSLHRDITTLVPLLSQAGVTIEVPR